MLREYDCPQCGARIDALAHRTHCPRCGGDLPQVSSQVAWQPEQAIETETPADVLRPRADPSLANGHSRGATLRRTDASRVLAGILWAGLVLAVGIVAWSFLDLDGDGMPAWRELQAHANPFSGDSDGDGLPDGWEADRGLRPDVADTDGDGLGDGDELRRSLDPRQWDTDGDGVQDGVGPDPVGPTCGPGAMDARCDLVAPPPVVAGLAGNLVYGVALLAATLVAAFAVSLLRRPAPQGL